MKSINQIFITNPSLIDESEVKQLIEYCRELEDEVIELKQKDVAVTENKLTVLVSDIYHSINDVLRKDAEAIRFGDTERIDFNESIINLKEYLLDFSRNNKFYF